MAASAAVLRGVVCGARIPHEQRERQAEGTEEPNECQPVHARILETQRAGVHIAHSRTGRTAHPEGVASGARTARLHSLALAAILPPMNHSRFLGR